MLSVTGKITYSTPLLYSQLIPYSITAGFGIMGVNTSLPPLLAMLDSYKEYRGLSYSIGGDEGALTIPNYIKHYQPNVTGYSIGQHLGEYCNGKLGIFNIYSYII